MGLTPEEARAWMRVVRDAALLLVAVFMLVYETVAVPAPNLYVIGGALTLAGLPPAFRLDEVIRASRPPEG